MGTKYDYNATKSCCGTDYVHRDTSLCCGNSVGQFKVSMQKTVG